MRFDGQVREWLMRTPGLVESLFDGLRDAMRYVKDGEGRCLWANQTPIDRSELEGRRR